MNKNKGIIGIGLIIAIVLGIVVVGGGAYYLGKSGSKLEVKSPENVLPNTDNQVEDNKIKKSETVTPNALLYKGDGFTVNSPYSLSYITVNKEPSFSPNTESIHFNNGDCISSECQIAVTIYIKDGLSNKNDFDVFVNNFLNNFSSNNIIFPSRDKITATNVKVDNEPAVQYTFESFAGGYNGIVYITVLFHNNKAYIVWQKDTTIAKFLPSFKFTNSEESLTEVFNHQAGAIKSIKADGLNKWIFAVDLLTHNPGWLPGVNDRYLNQNTKIRNLNVTSSTKTYGCVSGPDGGGPNLSTVPNTNTASYVSNIQKNITQAKLDIKYRIGGPIEMMTDWETLSFDINGSNITAIYNICLP